MSTLSGKRRVFLPLLVSVAAWVVFWQTLLPTISPWGDSAKFQYIAQVWGIPHPSGYPLFVLLTRLAGWLPWGDVAYRVNLLTAGFGALAAGALAILARQITGKNWPAFVAALLVTFCPIYWSQAIAAEVYTLNAFWVALCLALLVHWRTKVKNSASPRTQSIALFSFCFAYAASFSHHLSMILLAPAFLWLVAATHPSVFLKRSSWVAGGLAVMAGLLPYSYIVVRAAQGATYSEFPAIGDSSIWLAFLDYVTGAQFRSGFFAVFAQGPAAALGRITDYLRFLLQQFHWWGLALTALGVRYVWTKDKVVWLTLILAFLGETIFPLGYDVIDPEVFFIPSLLLLALFVAGGLAWIEQTVLSWLGAPAARGLWIRTALIVAGTALAAGTLIYNWGPADQSHNRWGRLWAEAFLSGMEDNALVVLPQPYFYSQKEALLYLQAVEGKVPDMRFIDRTEVSKWVGRRPVYLALMLPELKEEYRLLAVDSSQQTLGEFLDAFPAGVIVLAAVKDEASMALSQTDAQAWQMVGASGNLRGCFRCGHALIGVKGAAPGTAVEAVGLDLNRLDIDMQQPIGNTETLAPTHLMVISAGFEAGDVSEIWVGRRQVAPNHRGYNIVVLDPNSGQVLSVAYADTFESNLINNVRKYRLELR